MSMIEIDDLSLRNKYGFLTNKRTYTKRIEMAETHYHHHYEILYIKTGSRILRIGNGEYELNKNTVALIPPFIPHMTLSGHPPQERYLINFRANFLNNIENAFNLNLTDIFDPLSPVIPIENFFNKFCRILDSIFEDFSNIAEPFALNLATMHLTELLILLHKNASRSEWQNNVKDIVEYIEQNFSKTISLESLEKQFLISKYTISRNFKATTGFSIPKYIAIIRVIQAKKLIETGMNLTDVALSCGFNSLNDFDRVFKTETGMSPLKYKKTYTKE